MDETMNHTRGSHADDPNDTEPCDCVVDSFNKNMAIVVEYEKMWSKELLHRYSEMFAIRHLKNYLMDFKDMHELDLELKLMLEELHKRLPSQQRSAYFVPECPDCHVVFCGKHI